jgi:nucleoside diphosphate kinase
MAIELSYVIITPYTIRKSRTGGVMSRLLSRTDLELVGARIITPTLELTEAYAKALRSTVKKRDERSAEMLSDYVLENFAPTEGRGHRLMLLLFKGEDACRKLFDIAGNLGIITGKTGYSKCAATGETIRDTYADVVLNPDGSVRYFEPAVLTPPEQSLETLKLFAEFCKNSSNVVQQFTEESPDHEQTLVIIKPENWRGPSVRPGNIIDMFSRTGLRIVGCKIFQMSVAQGLEFYGPVQGVLRGKLAPNIGAKAMAILEKELEFHLAENVLDDLTDIVGRRWADNQFNRIIEFMTGRRADTCPEDELEATGKAKCMIVIYDGPDAVNKIRNVLGPTDPNQAPGGTIRKEFGQDVMVNTAHASDSPENAVREMGIVRIEDNPIFEIVQTFMGSQ